MNQDSTHKGSQRNLLGDSPSSELLQKLSTDKQVTPQTPPTFLFHTNEDAGVPAENSVQFYLALRKAGVPGELHIFQKGEHGVGLAPSRSRPARVARAAVHVDGGVGGDGEVTG